MIPDYYNRVNPDLLAALPPGLGTVVEVGCGAGALGAAYKSANPGCRWHGIELMAEPAAVAATRLDAVRIADVDAADPTADVCPDPVDCFVYGDVLEHLRDPWALVTRHAAMLSPTGLMVACIPNVQHWTIVESLLRGRWDYADEGLMDRTHIRWFTLDGMASLFQRAGLHAYDAKPRIFGHEAHAAFLQRMQSVTAALGLDAPSFAMRTGAIQFVVRAGRLPTPP